MARPSHRDKILSEGLRVVHERGFSAASVRDIVRAAGVPQGSFTNHFASKQAFGLEILEIYFARSRELMDRTLRDTTRTPLERLHAYLEAATATCEADGQRGCLLGNFSAEAGEHGEAIRQRVVDMLTETEGALTDCLKAAVGTGELRPDLDCQETATLILSALQGAVLLAKAQGSPDAIERLKRSLFATILAPAVPA